MPVMDGLEATRAIRLNNAKQPVIISMTASAMLDDKEACLQAGMNDYIAKPIKLEDLVNALERATELLANQTQDHFAISFFPYHGLRIVYNFRDRCYLLRELLT